MFEEAIELLEKDRIRNVNALNFMRDNRINSTEIVGDSVLIRGYSDRPWVYISSQSQPELEELTRRLKKEDKCFAVIEDWMLPHLCQDEAQLRWKLTSVKLYYPDATALPDINLEEDVIVKMLHINDAQFMFDNYEYKAYASVQYIRDRIEKGVSLGLYKNERLVGWIMTHDDGAMGFLHILETYRNKGYAMALSVSLIKMLRAMGEIPFVHIEPHNNQSMQLALKAGFEKDRLINWFEKK
ncbi:MAG: GNAT family N-acetyltransferase [Clostridia bacterium]|nr:GNAT family N-acetyltransferase [Clostridia bacterium]